MTKLLVRNTNDGGFSVVELIVASAVALLVLGTAFALIGRSGNVTRVQQPLAYVQNDLKNVVAIMERDVKMAGFFDTINTPRTQTSTAFVGIPTATSTANGFQLITQEWDGAQDVPTTIDYSYDSQTRQLRRNNLTLLRNASPIDANVPVFAYVDDPNDGNARIGVILNIDAETAQVDPETQQPIRRRISTTILSRNGKYASDRLILKPPANPKGGRYDFSGVPIAVN